MAQVRSANAVPATGAAIVLATAVAAASFANARRVTDSLLMHPPLLFDIPKLRLCSLPFRGGGQVAFVAWPPIVPSTLTLARPRKGKIGRIPVGMSCDKHDAFEQGFHRARTKKSTLGPVFAGGSVYNSGTEEVRGISEGMCVPALRRLVTFRDRRPSKRSHRCSEL